MKPKLSESSRHYRKQGFRKSIDGSMPTVSKKAGRKFFAFEALTVKNYRRYASANLISSISLWTVRTAQDWIVLQLSGSTAAVGVTVALQFFPTLLFSPLGGLVVDRYDKRKLLLITQSSLIVVGTALASLAFTDRIEVWHIYVAALVTGLATVIDHPARMVYFSELVGKKYLKNAVSINSIIFQLGAMVGPALGGALLKFAGGGWVFGCSIVAGCYAVVTIWRIKVSSSQRGYLRNYRNYKEQFLLGWRYFWGKTAIRYTAIMLFCTALFAFAMPVMMAAFAQRAFALEVGGFGLLNSCVALGALLGALLSTKRRTLRLRTVIFGAIRLGLAMIAASLIPLDWAEPSLAIFDMRLSFSVVLFCGMMVVVGLCSLLFLTSANQLVQTSTNQEIRGRVMSFYIMFLLGGQSLSGPIIGQLAEFLSPDYVLRIAGAVPVIVGFFLAIYLKRRGCLKLTVSGTARRFTVSID